MGKSIYEKVVNLPAPIAKKIIDFSDFIKTPKLCIENRRQIRQFFQKHKKIAVIGEEELSYKDRRTWEKGLLYYAISSPRAARKIADNFCNCKLECKKSVEFHSSNKPIFLCVVKNDLERVKLSYEHHKAIGIEDFVYIDNGSSDGTFEWLLQQDVTVYQTLDAFIMWAKVAWVSKVITHIGFDRWYLILDSDELFSYPGCEDKQIDEYVACLEMQGIKRAESFMLDMYSREELFQGAKTAKEIKEQLRYFDVDSYQEKYCMHYKKILGGPRERIFGNPDSVEMLQNKYALVYYQRGDIYRYHYVSPYLANFGSECSSVLLHYKFIGGDLEKYISIAQSGNYANGSQLYKDIVQVVEQEDRKLSFYEDNSVEYQSSESLLLHPIVRDWRK